MLRVCQRIPEFWLVAIGNCSETVLPVENGNEPQTTVKVLWNCHMQALVFSCAYWTALIKSCKFKLTRRLLLSRPVAAAEEAEEEEGEEGREAEGRRIVIPWLLNQYCGFVFRFVAALILARRAGIQRGVLMLLDVSFIVATLQFCSCVFRCLATLWDALTFVHPILKDAFGDC